MNGVKVSDMAQMMKAIAIQAAGGPENLVVEDRPLPVLGAGELLIKVAAAGVNRPDVLQRMGHYPPPAGVTDIPGLEVSGTVVAVGEGVEDSLMGRDVCALVAGGGYAEYCAAPVGSCLPVPDGFSMEQAAALPETIFTVWHNLFERGYVTDGETALIHGGTSGIGTTAIGLCKLFGVRVIVTCGSDEKCAAARALGADLAINYRDQDYVEAVKAFTDGAGANVILDMVGGDYVPRNLACLAEEGRHVTIAFQRGAKAEINISQLMIRRQTMTGSTLRARSAEFKAGLAQEIEAMVWPKLEAGEWTPAMDRIFAYTDAPAAHRHMQDGAHVGKIILSFAA